MVADDENDQGYYDDEPVTQEEVSKLILILIHQLLTTHLHEKNNPLPNHNLT